VTSLLDQVIEKYPKQVKIVYKNFPIRSHKYSEPAAKAALAAQKQGKFWPFHDLLYAHFKGLSDKKMRDIACRHQGWKQSRGQGRSHGFHQRPTPSKAEPGRFFGND